MISRLRRPAVGALVAASALGVAACGGSSSEPESAGGGSSASLPPGAYDPTQTPPKGKKGGTITMLAPGGDIINADPGLGYYQFDYVFSAATQRRLFYYQPNQPEKPVPDLADGPAQISDDQKTVTVKLKKGVKFAPPVNREVQAKDIKYAIERTFTENVPGPYPQYYDFIKGAPDGLKGSKPDIAGIETPDPYTVKFTLDAPRGEVFVQSMTLPYTAPVPEEYAKAFDAKSPSEYDNNVTATGPYMFQNDAKGKIEGIGWDKTKSITLVRNPNWDAKTDFRPAYVDKYQVKTDSSDGQVAARQVLSGKNMLLDTNPPASVLEQLVTKTKDQYTQVPSRGFRYFSMNFDVKPFDDINVRKAVIAGFDREAARQARGGKFIGPVPNGYIPANFAGFEQSGGAKGFGQDFMANPKGDPAVSAKYFKAAGYASGKYEGDEEILIVGANAEPGKAPAQVAQRELQRMGFKTQLRLVPQDAVYNDFCGQRSKKVAVCGTAGWFADFSDPSTLLEVPFGGTSIPTGKGEVSYNLSFIDDPKVNTALKEAIPSTGDARGAAYAKANKAITDAAPTIPFVSDGTTLVRSKNVQGVPDMSNLWDLSFTSVK